MKESEIIHIQERVGTTGDGFWGPKSIAACQKYLRSLMPSPHPFPAEGSSAFHSFYGPHGERGGYTPPGKKITLPFAVFYEGAPVKTLTVHEKCADSLLRVFERLAEALLGKSKSSPKSGGTEKKIIRYIVFPGSGDGRPKPADVIAARVDGLLASLSPEQVVAIVS